MRALLAFARPSRRRVCLSSLQERVASRCLPAAEGDRPPRRGCVCAETWPSSSDYEPTLQEKLLVAAWLEDWGYRLSCATYALPLWPLRVILSMNLRNSRRCSFSFSSASENFRRTPNDGALRVTIPFNTTPLTQILPFATHNPTPTFFPGGTGVAVSTNAPPRPTFERLPQIGLSNPSIVSSTATKHLMRAKRRRSCAVCGVNKSGANGGVSRI